MELPGSSYLYTIATLSITYAGFAALIVIFRQIIGGGVSSYDIFIIRSLLMRSFIIAFSAMLPPALALFDVSQSFIWRASSLFCGSSAELIYSDISSKTTRRNAPPHK
jgi:hypothetical protein